MFSNSSRFATNDSSSFSMTERLFGRHRDKMVARAITGSHRGVCFRNGMLVTSPSCGVNVSLNRDDDICATCDLAGSAREFVRYEDIGTHEQLPT